MAECMDDGMQLVKSFTGQMDKLYKQNSFHDIVFVLRYKYVSAHKKAWVVLGERREIIGEMDKDAG